MGKGWTVEQLMLLCNKYPAADDLEVLSQEIGKPVKTIKNKAARLSIKRLVTPVRKKYKPRKAKVIAPDPVVVLEIKRNPIEVIEEDIELTLNKLSDNPTRDQWAIHVRRYHALCIKLEQIRGNKPGLLNFSTEHII